MFAVSPVLLFAILQFSTFCSGNIFWKIICNCNVIDYKFVQFFYIYYIHYCVIRCSVGFAVLLSAVPQFSLFSSFCRSVILSSILSPLSYLPFAFSTFGYFQFSFSPFGNSKFLKSTFCSTILRTVKPRALPCLVSTVSLIFITCTAILRTCRRRNATLQQQRDTKKDLLKSTLKKKPKLNIYIFFRYVLTIKLKLIIPEKTFPAQTVSTNQFSIQGTHQKLKVSPVWEY